MKRVSSEKTSPDVPKEWMEDFYKEFGKGSVLNSHHFERVELMCKEGVTGKDAAGNFIEILLD